MPEHPAYAAFSYFNKNAIAYYCKKRYNKENAYFKERIRC